MVKKKWWLLPFQDDGSDDPGLAPFSSWIYRETLVRIQHEQWGPMIPENMSL